MSKKKSRKISTLGSQAMSIISVSLVLLIVGILSAMGIVTSRITSQVMSNVSIIVKMGLMATDEQASALRLDLVAAPYSAQVSYTSKDEVLAKEMEYNAEILELLAENPYSSEFEVKLKPQYVHPDSVKAINAQLTSRAEVDEVISQVDMISAMQAVSRKATITLSCIAAALLAISLVLIYNTVSIAVYARRFVIRTMQLVGATSRFIRRPFVLSGVMWGVISGLLASAMLFGAKAYFSSAVPELSALLPWGDVALVSLGLLALGVAICAIAAFFATTRYLRASYDTLYTT